MDMDRQMGGWMMHDGWAMDDGKIKMIWLDDERIHGWRMDRQRSDDGRVGG